MPIVQKDDYYPFGLTFNSYTRPNANSQDLKYQQKEWQSDLELDIYDFHARGYDPVLGRAWQLDPHCENYFSWSPYSWTGDNPILNIDPSGMDWFVSNANGVVINIQGESDFSYANLQDQYGKEVAQFIYELSGAGNDSWENFGSDDMFDSKENKLSEKLSSLTIMTEEASEQFMSDKGYSKGVYQKVSELSIDFAEAEPYGIRFDNVTQKRIVDRKVSYFKNNEFGKVNSINDEIKSENGFMFKMKRITYFEKIRYKNRLIKGKDKIMNNGISNILKDGVSIYSNIIDILEANARNRRKR